MSKHVPERVLEFWFAPDREKQWFKKDPAFDALIADQFDEVYAAAALGELWPWRDTAPGRLAEIIVLDQFPRNMFRGQAMAFATDPLALVLAQEAIGTGADRDIEPTWRQFVYMPFMHSESLAVHEKAVELFRGLEEGDNLRYEMRHLEILKRFGRYPHRNEILGRESTPEEVEFLAQPGSRF